ncbi:Beta-ketoacyl synthase [Cordyceps militaris CM01]|uniref:Beta-ketoacyl synthase n=1 Tax=Cordyceps militaris (strain CM01) TaxID=983644 RepID=G3J535_CORMM|nr:Beta-ketoacyl synthase [Cordyceps militaris CM01]EGX95949.1 Beta-ketoacyl synthase [Cordyceps militaris CM01]
MVYQTTPAAAGNSKADNCPDDPIVIVGAACRLAGEASSLDNLWNMMKNSRTAHAKVPKERWDADAWYHPDPDRKGSLNTTHGFFLEQDIAAFDAPFFTINAKEAAGMDPAKRLLLEVAYETFENAGMPLEKIAGSKTGVYVGSMTSDYEDLSTREIYDEPHMAAAGSSEAMTANRVSWFFDLRGPSLTLDTACSSSLYALHLACQSLRLGETDMGLVAGVSVILHPNFMQQLVAMHMLSPDGISHTFDDRANGYGRGEGIGALVVKRLSDALRDGDTIRAVIRGVGSNVDGKTPSVTMPSAEAQAELIREVYKQAKLPMASTPYVELHGTGTPVGDPIELSAIAATFGAAAPPDQPVYVGSIKPTVGHTEGCAGLVGVFKAMLSLERGVLLPTAEVRTVNPRLRLADWNIALPPATMPWPAGAPRRVSVNSFGFGGANAHVILDGASAYLRERGLPGHASDESLAESMGLHGSSKPQVKPQQTLYPLSARDEAGVARTAKALGAYLETQKDRYGAHDLASLAHTLSFRRSELECRSFVVTESVSDLAHKLAAPSTSMPRAARRSAKHNRLAFIFTGQGAQWAGMGRQLYGQFDAFTQSIVRSSRCLAALGCPFGLEAELQRTEHSLIETAEVSQPMCTAVQLALVDLLRDWGVVPGAVVGHSSGEIAAAYAARRLTHEDSVTVAYLRGVYSGMVSKGGRVGAMLAAGISEAEAETYLKDVPAGSVVVACVNSPKSVTLSGDADVVTQLEATIAADGKFARKLRVMTAYHSPHMQSVADSCLQAMRDAGVGQIAQTGAEDVSIPIFSSVTGEVIDPVELDPTYWIRNMCGTVRFFPAVTNLLAGNLAQSLKRRTAGRKPAVKWDAMVEIGPHSALKAPLVQIMEELDSKLPTQLPYTSLLVRKEDAVATALAAAGALWSAGVKIALDRVNRQSASSAHVVATDLPAYAWNHDKTFWHEAPATRRQRLQSRPRTDLLGAPVENQNPLEPQWRNHLRVRESPWAQDHKITGTILYPGAGMLIMVMEAVADMARGQAATPVQGIEFRNVRFEKGLVIPQEGATETILRIQLPQSSGPSPAPHSFAIFSRIGDAPWVKNCHGRFHILHANSEAAETTAAEETTSTLEWKRHIDKFHAAQQSNAIPVDVGKLYTKLHGVGMQYGPTFQNVTELKTVPDGELCYGAVKIPDTKSVMPFEYEFSHLIHPATLDAIFHLIVVAVAGGASLTEAAVPSMLGKLYISFDLPQGPGQEFVGYAERVHRRDGKLCADLVVSDGAWQKPKVTVQGLIMTRVSSDSDTLAHPGQGAVAKKTTTFDWKVDPGFFAQISSTGSLANVSSLKDWLELECHKSTNLSVVFIGQTLAEQTIDKLLPFLDSTSHYRGISHLTITDISKDALELWKTKTTLADTPINFVTESGWTESSQSYDIVIVGAAQSHQSETLHTYQTKLNTGGRIVVLGSDVKVQVFNSFNGVNGDTSTNSHSGVGKDFLKLHFGESTPLAVYTEKRQQTPIEGELLLLVPSITDTSPGVSSILDQLNKCAVATRLAELKDATLLQSGTVLCLLSGSLVNRWTSEEFQHFQTLISSASRLCWVTSGAQMLQPSQKGLDASGVSGLLRVLRNEFPQVALSHLDLSFDPNAADEKGAKFVVDVLHHILSLVAEGELPELELAELDVFKVPAAGSQSAARLWIELMVTFILEYVTHLAAGETILVQDADSLLGHAIIARATKEYGAQVHATVSNTEQKIAVIHRTGLGPDSVTVHPPGTGSSLLFSHLLEKTQGMGIDVAVQAGHGLILDEDAAICLAELARVAIVLQPDQATPPLPALGGNVTWATVDPVRILTEQPRWLAKLLSRISQAIPAPSDFQSGLTFSVTELDKAVEAAESGSPRGLVSISLVDGINGAGPSVRVIPPAPQMPKLDKNATYIMAGGLGSLGLRIAELMAKNGATHLVFLSRSGGNHHNGKLSTLHALGCVTLVLACDVTSEESVQAMVQEVEKIGRPIKGIIQCAMVLQDSLFDKMSYKQWQTAFKPKVDGSWNLHSALPSDMAFFIMLSSVVSVIGNVAQANYAAGNSYMDALARYRRSLGMAGTSINAGLVADSDHTIDGTSMKDYLERFKHMASVSTTLSELDVAVAAAMRGTVGNGDTKTSSQFVFCMTDSLEPAGVDFWAGDAKFIHRVLRESTDAESGADGGQEISVAVVLAAATAREDCQVAIQDVIKKLLAPGLGVQPGDIDVERPLYELGVDSFKAVEVRNQIFRQLKCDVSVFEILSPNSLTYLAEQLVSRSPLVPAELIINN